MAFSKKRLAAFVQGKLNYGVFINGSCVFVTCDFMHAVQQLDYLQKQHPDQDVKFEILEAYQDENQC